ncbi:MAG TPA: preprotein translocase subunit SecG [Candidatus Paceibacterota bacterium]|nr:preprotein translocase subunit SecG [Candidatus Paceibacterota bacterium]
MSATLHSLQLVIAIVLIALVLLQRTSGDTNSSFGESSFFQTRRGVERFLFILTIVVAILFAGISIWVIALA